MIDFCKIRLLVTDLDGTLTDGNYIVSDTGSISKKFNTRDFMALERMQVLGVTCLILTHAMDDVIKKKWESLGHGCKSNLYFYRSTLPKELVLDKLRSEMCKGNVTSEARPYEFDEIAYIGDTESDLEVMEKCAWTGCPADAEPIILENVNYVCDSVGGGGAVYEFVTDLINRMSEENGTPSDTKGSDENGTPSDTKGSDENGTPSDTKGSDEVEEVAASSN